ncbi:hypothetical protein TNIN_268461 [Trichonephila inaurata madagascariensis]|uniref:Uncharacterized protein n=1 Tax=Trichonephila inaurata madagascariensis TaxID=2747483 RepID=A0A8X6YRE7_9ARAC|nr:hypothetical protein TNIN_268461 [Trichonephila inaurata madagascariensis]
MGPKSKPKSSNNESTSSDSCEINMERFAYDVFVSIFIRLGVTDFPPFDGKRNHYKNNTILKSISAEVLFDQFYFRDEFMEAFKLVSNMCSSSNFEDFANYVYDGLKVSDADAQNYVPDTVFTLFFLHAELFLYFQSQNISVDFVELHRSWCKIYTRDIFKFVKDDISEITKAFGSVRRVELTEAIVSYFLLEYFMPYGAKEDCSEIFRLVDDKFPTGILNSDETINAQLIERIAKRVLSEEAAKKSTASEGQGIPPPQSADLTATSSTLPRRKPGSLSYSQWIRKKGSI